MLLHNSWQTLRDRVNSRLDEYMQQGPDCPSRLQSSMSYSLMAGGKRLRPVLLLLACEAAGGDVEAALPAACAVEMVHTYSLIHDDLPAMDNDDLRRGCATNHVKFDQATAILAGDALLTLAFETLASEVDPPEVAASCCADLAAAAGPRGMIAGQMADLEGEGRFSSGLRLDNELETIDASTILSGLEAIHRRKTGCLLGSAVTIGARIAGADTETLKSLTEYGKSVGLAFQIADDLLDVSGDRAKMGKKVQKDDSEGKLTYPAILGVAAARTKAEQLIEQACQSIAPLGDRGQRLEELAQFVLERDH